MIKDRATIYTIGEASLYRRARKNRERTRQNIENLREAFESLKQAEFNWKLVCDRASNFCLSLSEYGLTVLIN